MTDFGWKELYAHLRIVNDKSDIFNRTTRVMIISFIFESVSQQPTRLELLKNYAKNPPLHEFLQELELPLLLE